MNIDDIKDQIIERAKTLSEQIQESSIYINLKERYENLSANGQRLTIVGASAFCIFLVLYSPFSWLTTSSDYVTDFEETRGLIRELLQSSRDPSATLAISIPGLPIPQLQSQVEETLKRAQLSTEQINSIKATSEPSRLIPSELSFGDLEVSLQKLNIKQIVDLGHNLQSLNPLVKLKDLQMKANSTDQRYFDVIYTLSSINAPTTAQSGIETPENPPNNKEPSTPPRKGRFRK